MDDAVLRAVVAAFPPVWLEAFRGLKIDLTTEAGRARLEYTNVIDLSPLAGLTRLHTLNVSSAGVVDLGPLRGVPLRHLVAYRTKITEAAFAAFRAEHPSCTVEHGDAYPDRATRCGC
jgi:hypothetical protein